VVGQETFFSSRFTPAKNGLMPRLTFGSAIVEVCFSDIDSFARLSFEGEAKVYR
jgi:hypothetical protein